MEGLRVNGIFYTVAAMQQNIFPDGEVWEKELSDFLQEWFNEHDFVSGHTSGSTGKPKEIRLSKTDMLASARLTNDFFNLNRESKLLLCLSPNYIAGKMMIVRALLAGASLIAQRPDNHPFRQLQTTIDLAAVVPMQLEETLKSETASLSLIKNLLIGGAPVSPSLEEKLQRLETICLATYGMTETVSHIALKELNGAGEKDVYFALGQVHFETDNRNCLIIQAPHLQQQQFITNDIVHLTDSRHFEWKGRYDNVINSGGVKISPEILEQQLSAFIPGRFFITSQPDERLSEKIILVIEGEPYSIKRLEILKGKMLQALSRFEIPKDIRFVKKFGQTYSGKIIRKIQSDQK